jgi:uncharacterized protein YebE (UPF0316 family)
MIICLIIFINKIIENMLGTVRIIVIAKNKKITGAILNGLISLIWILSTSMVLINVDSNPYKIFFFCLGAMIGSYLGSSIEEKMYKEKKA